MSGSLSLQPTITSMHHSARAERTGSQMPVGQVPILMGDTSRAYRAE